jgi:predicted deacylase
VNDYAALTRRLKALPRRHWRVERAGLVSGYPFYTVRRQVADDAPTILLTAGMHGDEPAGVEAALRWLEGNAWRRWPVNWLVLPCLNPFGWTHQQRANAAGQDINRQFRGANGCVEATWIKSLLGNQGFALALDFHEDSDADGYYLCEITGTSAPIGEQIVTAVRRVTPVSRARVLDGRRATAPGLVRRVAHPSDLQRRKQWPLAFYLIRCCTNRFLCSETSMHPPLQRRVAAHHAALRAACNAVGINQQKDTQS